MLNQAPKKYYIYKLFKIFITTFFLRFKRINYIFLSVLHLASINLLLKFKILSKNKFIFFLFDGALLGAVRQGAIAGRAKDVDLGIICNNETEILEITKYLKEEFKIKFTGKKSCHLFYKDNSFIDLSFFILDEKKEKIYHYNNPLKKEMIFNKNDFFPFIEKKLYFENFYVPNNYGKILVDLYTHEWKKYKTKNQINLI